MEKQKVIISERLEQVLHQEIAACQADRLFVLTDDTTHCLCLPVVKGFKSIEGAQEITIFSGDTNKTLESVCHVWSELQRLGATRHSLLINLGGGMVTDHHKHPHHTTFHGRRFRRRQDRLQLRWTEK